MTPAHHIPIAIIGAGISGLTLSRALLARSIPSIIYERSPPPSQSPRHNYGITLSPLSCSSLVNLLDGRSLNQFAVLPYMGSLGSATGPIRLHRGRLEAGLAEGLDIRWDHGLTSVDLPQYAGASREGAWVGLTTLRFSNGSEASASLVVGADGVHSLLRNQLAPSQTPCVLPYVVFHGKLKLPDHAFRQIHKGLLPDYMAELRRDGYTLRILVDDVSSAGNALLSWTYSRQARGPEDALFKPFRALDEARFIPEPFYEEIEGIDDLQEPFKSVFAIDEVRKSRIQHWLMRDILFDGQELTRLAERGIVFLGDAAHAAPILGSRGADLAIQDALDLANCLAHHGLDGNYDGSTQEEMTNAISQFYKGKISGPEGSPSSWRDYVGSAESRLVAMHAVDGVLRGNM